MKLRIRRFFSFFVLLGLLLPNPVFAAGQAYVADPEAPVFINEIHYDNTSTDIGEAIEIAGPTGTDLSGWSLVLYNGSNGEPYTTYAAFWHHSRPTKRLWDTVFYHHGFAKRCARWLGSC